MLASSRREHVNKEEREGGRQETNGQETFEGAANTEMYSANHESKCFHGRPS